MQGLVAYSDSDEEAGEAGMSGPVAPAAPRAAPALPAPKRPRKEVNLEALLQRNDASLPTEAASKLPAGFFESAEEPELPPAPRTGDALPARGWAGLSALLPAPKNKAVKAARPFARDRSASASSSASASAPVSAPRAPALPSAPRVASFAMRSDLYDAPVAPSSHAADDSVTGAYPTEAEAGGGGYSATGPAVGPGRPPAGDGASGRTARGYAEAASQERVVSISQARAATRSARALLRPHADRPGTPRPAPGARGPHSRAGRAQAGDGPGAAIRGGQAGGGDEDLSELLEPADGRGRVESQTVVDAEAEAPDQFPGVRLQGEVGRAAGEGGAGLQDQGADHGQIRLVSRRRESDARATARRVRGSTVPGPPVVRTSARPSSRARGGRGAQTPGASRRAARPAAAHLRRFAAAQTACPSAPAPGAIASDLVPISWAIRAITTKVRDTWHRAAQTRGHNNLAARADQCEVQRRSAAGCRPVGRREGQLG